MQPLIINAAITGMVPMPADNASLPVTVRQIIAEARRCADAGASIIHVHARGEDGTPAWREGNLSGNHRRHPVQLSRVVDFRIHQRTSLVRSMKNVPPCWIVGPIWLP